MRQMEWCVENVEGAVAQLVIRELRFLERSFFVNYNKSTGVRRSAKRIINQACLQHCIRRQQIRKLANILTGGTEHAATTYTETCGVREDSRLHGQLRGISK